MHMQHQYFQYTNFQYIESFRLPQLYSGLRLGFGKNSGKFYVPFNSNPIQHRWFELSRMII